MSESPTPPQVKHQCGTCGAVFDSLEALQAHERQHKRERAHGEEAVSDTRRTGSHAGSNVSPVKEGKPPTLEGQKPAGPETETPVREPVKPPEKSDP
jgi:hypothetical protein